MIRPNLFVMLLIFFMPFLGMGQTSKQGNIVVVTIDGFRWQELFGGADESLMKNPLYTRDTAALRAKYGGLTAEERRKKLLPFFWSVMAKEGQLLGNRWSGNKVDVKNRYWFSYPGYNEIFTGYPDTLVNSNDKNPNQNINVLEFINTQSGYHGRVAAFTSWDVFDAILNEKRSGMLVSSGFDRIPITSPTFDLLNEMQMSSPQPLGEGVRPDHITYHIAKEYIKEKKPKVIFISFDETDDYAHEGRYDDYLNAVYNVDKWMADLWKMLQSMEGYSSNTTFIITADHGRGDEVKSEWTSHGKDIKGASQIWLAMMGKGILPKGEIKGNGQLYQAQLAQTMAALLEFHFQPAHPVEPAIPLNR